MIAETSSRKRWIAFLTTTAAVFTLCCLVWPLSVSGFRTSSYILVDSNGQSSESLENALARAVQAQINDENLEQYIQLIEESGNLRSRAIEYRDFQTIRESIRIGHVASELGPKLKIAYEGNGGADERQLVNLLSQSVFSNLSQTNNDVVASQSKVERFKQAEWIIDQIEADLKVVKDSLGAKDPGLLALDGSSDSNFHLASSKKVVSPSADEIQASIDSIDIENLRVVIEGLKADAVPQGGSAYHDSDSGSMAYQNVKPSSTLPINGVPDTSWLMLIGLFSLVVGTAVALNLKPFEKLGFDDTQSIREKLEVPIIATLNLDSPEEVAAAESSEIQVALANRVARIAGTFLLGVVLIILGFIIINTEVREAFWQNPFFGCAKIVRIFTGH